ncbi:hypothetical protein IC614_06750 [Allosphingosinicella flava]|uniref:DUF3052 domain-containing protein n=1 Tax=Allosphingosinicella flava TaxID=2771430 RepID=A0A7T2LL41_9SPHN|nr:hypothetical protein [Sphingosinicella flava]QPQ54071.1 hypothetical protein IC614_06750 [Sphingosinicella flava]
MTGYSGTPLWKKLSLKDGQRVWREGMPDTVRTELETGGLTLIHLPAPEAPVDAAHIFVTETAKLEEAVHRLLPVLAPTGFLWISWPKKASKVPTDITEDRIRDIVLPTGLVDVKVCAVDAIWSGLKLMIRKDRR